MGRFEVRLALTAILIVSMWGCSQDPSGERGAGNSSQNQGVADSGSVRQENTTYSIAIRPSQPTSQDDLIAILQGNPEGVVLSWERNGEILFGETGDRLTTGKYIRGDTITVHAERGGQKTSASTTIGNAPPKILSVPFTNPRIRAGVDMEVRPEAEDPDGDYVSFQYRWFLNHEEQPENGSLFPGSRIRKGDRISVRVIPSDGIQEGEVFYGGEMEIPNAPPKFLSQPPLDFKGTLYTYAPQVEDPDGDRLTFSLQEAPAGLKVDPATGRLSWTIGPRDQGQHLIRILAEDESGSKTFQEYDLTINIW